MRSCVVFLGRQEAGPADVAPIAPTGTGFFVHGGKTFPGRAYLVTARHVAEALRPPFVVRINKKGGGAGLVPIAQPDGIDWCHHDDSTVDLAVAPFSLPNWATARGLNAEGLLEDVQGLGKVGPGDMVYVIGLFHLLYGKRENLPVTHVGHIAMMPGDEPIPVGRIHREGYLVQANAISGCSGSPVFALRTYKVTILGHTFFGHFPEAMVLGVWSASWKVKGSEVVSVGSHDGDPDAAGQLAPLGMGFVTPLPKLVDTMQDPASFNLEAVKQKIDAAVKNKPGQ